MNLPLINGPMKQHDRKANSNKQIPPLEEFGLGIQVFKIDSSKAADNDRNKPRKIIKNIEQPVFSRPNPVSVKKPHILPTLSAEKKLISTCQSESIKQRKSTVQKRKMLQTNKPLRQIEQKRPLLQKKTTWGHSAPKSAQPEQTIMVQKDPQVVQKHFRNSLNDLQVFSQRLEEAQLDNLKQIKRLRRQKQNAQQALEWRLKCKSDRKFLIDEIVQTTRPFFDEEEDTYDQFNLSSYVQNGCAFKFYDSLENKQEEDQ